LFTSPCCNAFNKYDESGNIICSRCNSVIHTLKDDEVVTVGVKYNAEQEETVSADILTNFRNKAARFSQDPTFALTSTKCKKCGSLCRYSMDQQRNIIYICSNKDCRTVSS